MYTAFREVYHQQLIVDEFFLSEDLQTDQVWQVLTSRHSKPLCKNLLHVSERPAQHPCKHAHGHLSLVPICTPVSFPVFCGHAVLHAIFPMVVVGLNFLPHVPNEKAKILDMFASFSSPLAPPTLLTMETSTSVLL